MRAPRTCKHKRRRERGAAGSTSFDYAARFGFLTTSGAGAQESRS
jgi:hypothetical protein